MEFTISYDKGIYTVVAEGINAKVESLSYRPKVSGKGSRNYKNEIIAAAEEFAQNESKKRHQQKEKEVQEKHNTFKQSEAYSNIDLLSLYKAELNYYDSYHGDWVNFTQYLTGVEIKDDSRIINAELYTINNTDIFAIGSRSDSHQTRKSLSDQRIFIINHFPYVTGLALKEMLLNGLKSYGNIRLIKDTELRIIQQYGQSGATSFMLFDTTSQTEKQSSKERYNNEMQRAINSPEKVTLEKQYANDGKEIKRAFFSSKPCSFKDLQENYCATYEKYIVEKSITVDKDTFDLFKESFDMSLLGVEFKGGSNSTYEPKEEAEDFYQLSEMEQSHWINGAYNIALEVKCNDYDYSLVCDPQGYDYARYCGIVKNESNITDTPKKTGKVIDFNSKRKEKQEQKEISQLTDKVINEVVPYMSKQEIQELAELYKTGNEEQIELFFNQLILITAARRGKQANK